MSARTAWVFVLGTALTVSLPAALAAQAFGRAGGAGSLEAMHARTASGTSWQPDATPTASLHAAFGSWRAMLHGSASFGYVREKTARGGARLGSVNWAMVGAQRALAAGRLALTGGAPSSCTSTGVSSGDASLRSRERRRADVPFVALWRAPGQRSSPLASSEPARPVATATQTSIVSCLRTRSVRRGSPERRAALSDTRTGQPMSHRPAR